MNESQLLSAQMRRKVTQNKWNSQIFTQIFSFLALLQLDGSSPHMLLFDLFSKTEKDVFSVRKQCFPSQKRVFSKSENALKNYWRLLFPLYSVPITVQIQERLLGHTRSTQCRSGVVSHANIYAKFSLFFPHFLAYVK